MASFFQPGQKDPTIEECSRSTFEIYCNSILPADKRFNNLFQLSTFTIGATAILVSLLYFLVCILLQSRKSDSPKTLW